MSSNRKFLAAAALLALTGCGFTPLYGGSNGDAVQAQLDTVKVGLIPNREGQLLRQSLQTQLQIAGSPTQELYLLTVNYSINQQAIGVQEDTSTSRNRYIATASWTLSPIGMPQNTLVTGQASTEDALNVIDQQYFAMTLENTTVTQELANEIAAQITSQVAAYFKTHPTNG